MAIQKNETVKGQFKYNDCGCEHDRAKSCHWIFINEKEGCIANEIFETKAGALAHSSFIGGLRSGYKLEHRFDERYKLEDKLKKQK